MATAGHRERGVTPSVPLCAAAPDSLWPSIFKPQAPAPIFRSGLDIFLDSGEDLRLNKSEISQASGFFG
jgi:hypothetical protein